MQKTPRSASRLEVRVRALCQAPTGTRGGIFDLARSLGLKKLTAHMTTDQRGAQAAFRRLGFVPEALLADYAEDRKGISRDLVIMSYDVEGLTDRVDEPLHI